MRSNDPTNTESPLSIMALVQVQFDFASNNLNFGKISEGETVTRSTSLQIMDPDKTKIIEITTSSPFVQAVQVPSSSSPGNRSEAEIQVTISPGLPPGRIHETVTARSNLESKPEAKLYLAGTVVGDVEVIPDVLRFIVDESKPEGEGILRGKLQIINRSASKTLRVLETRDPKNMLDLSLATVEEGQIYELTATLRKEALAVQGDTVAQLVIVTNDPEQKNITVSYRIIRRK